MEEQPRKRTAIPERHVHLDDKGTSAYTTSPADLEQEETDIM
jgi:hypothetical protein